MSNFDDLDRLYEVVKQKRGHVDIVFANAGIGELVPIGQITEALRPDLRHQREAGVTSPSVERIKAHCDRIFDINVKGLLFTVRKALPLLRDGGSVILNASVASITGNAAFSVYSASKAAVRSFARTWTVDLRARKIRVNAISPGPIDTPIFDPLAPTKAEVDRIKEGFRQRGPPRPDRHR